MGGVNASGQVPDIPNLPSLIDMDTPDEIRNSVRTGFNGREYQLVFSDEFNTDGRTFYPGDDPFVSLYFLPFLLHHCVYAHAGIVLLCSFISLCSGRLSICTTGRLEIWNGTTLRSLLPATVTSTSQ